MEQKPMTTKQLIAKLPEIDPNGNKEIDIEVLGDDPYSHGLHDEYDLDQILLIFMFDNR